MQLNLFNRQTVMLKPSSNKTRECNKCGELKDLEDFHVPYYKKNNEKGRSHTCKACIRKQTQETAALRKIHPLPEDSCCQLCGEFSEHLHLDHNHEDGSFRGYLCANCNQGLGKFKDNVSVLALAIDYLTDRQK
jgi:hypothetical protein